MSASTLYRNGSIVVSCTRAVSMAVYGPCTRVHDRVHSHVHGRLRAVYTAVTNPFTGRDHDSVHGRANVYTARTQPCTAVRRPCTRAVNTAEYTPCTGRVQACVHGPCTGVHGPGRVRAMNTAVYTRSCTSGVHRHRRLCTRTVSTAVYTARPCTRSCTWPCTVRVR